MSDQNVTMSDQPSHFSDIFINGYNPLWILAQCLVVAIVEEKYIRMYVHIYVFLTLIW